MEKEKRIRITISMPKEMKKLIEEKASNKSRFIERALIEYFDNCGFDVSKIKL